MSLPDPKILHLIGYRHWLTASEYQPTKCWSGTRIVCDYSEYERV